MMLDLFDTVTTAHSSIQPLAPGAAVLRGFAASVDEALLAAVDRIASRAPFRHMITPGGFRMSVAMTNCGALGWVTDEGGYRYTAIDPESGRRWPSMPADFADLATRAAQHAGFARFVPDACLVNRYDIGSRLTLHQDRNERDYDAPIVSVSLGLPATFLFGGVKRSDRVARVPLRHADVVVWGGSARLRYHGVAVLKPGHHRLLGERRINLTFRKAG